MSKMQWLPILGLAGLLAAVSSAHGQSTAYIGYAYPAGGQQGTTVQVRLGGQRLDAVQGATVTGSGVTVEVVEYLRRIGNQEMQLIREQLRLLKRKNPRAAAKPNRAKPGGAKPANARKEKAKQELITRIERRIAEYCNRPNCAALGELAILEVTIAPNAEPGERELRLISTRGVTNPVPFLVGQVPEVARRPMKISLMQVLGKEGLALRKRPEEEVEVGITVPCTVNGQIASGEVNWYRFEARKGQRLVLSAAARQLVPYIADAVPGWFQPVLAVYDANKRELAYNDDFRFKPDPTLLFEVPEDGEYLFSITDAIYRGREDFVYRVSIGELPFVTSVFPLGGPAGSKAKIEVNGWNLEKAELTAPSTDAQAGVHQVFATAGGRVSNRVPFALDTLPECLDQESNNDPSQAQEVKLPVIVNGRIDAQDDWDVFKVAGKAGDTIVAEVTARRLDSPLDSMLRLTDENGKVLALNDDREDVASGLNTHHADSYIMAELPADGTYFVHLGDTTRNGGEAYAYRLRISPPRPDFELRVVPSRAIMRVKSGTAVNVYAIRKDGFKGEITLGLKDPPEGFPAAKIRLPADKDMIRCGLRTTLTEATGPISLTVEGRATIGEQELVRKATPAEDRMQAFLWRHLVPAQDLPALVYKAAGPVLPARPAPPPSAEPSEVEKPAGPQKFSKRQVQSRLRQLKRLYDEWLLTEEFYARKVAECEAAL